MNYQLFEGDCRHIMQGMAPNSIDSIVTDTPYGLGEQPDMVELLQQWLTEGHYDTGKGFMGKDWDVVPGPIFWREMYRVAKPGATLLAFGGTRTYDLISLAIRLGGWQLRDCVMWVYGSGFPKSHDISKAIDRGTGAEREIVGEGPYAARRPRHRVKAKNAYSDGVGDYGSSLITAPATPEAAQWQGWGTALKPAWEPIIVAMKPNDGTFANNALVHGVAGLNIDQCRIPITDGATMARNNKPGDNGWKNSSGGKNNAALHGEPNGRWPANVVHDGGEEVMALFPVTTSNARASKGEPQSSITKTIYGKGFLRGDANAPDDTGSAARFFYCAKASTSERNQGVEDGNTHSTVKPLELMRWLCRLTSTPTGGVVLDPFMGSGTTGVAALLEGRSFVGIELKAEHMKIARQRIEHYESERSVEPVKLTGKPSDTADLPLFA